MIKVEHANKTFSGKYGKVTMLCTGCKHHCIGKGRHLRNHCGFSGAGKSTLIRLVNGLETLMKKRKTVTVHGEELGSLGRNRSLPVN
ncbi:MAG: hypothetical protein V8R24_06735 [Dorea longicatena]